MILYLETRFSIMLKLFNYNYTIPRDQIMFTCNCKLISIKYHSKTTLLLQTTNFKRVNYNNNFFVHTWCILEIWITNYEIYILVFYKLQLIKVGHMIIYIFAYVKKLKVRISDNYNNFTYILPKKWAIYFTWYSSSKYTKT